MGRITQTQAEKVSKQLVEKIQKEIDSKVQERKEYLTAQYKDSLPKDVVRMWERGKKWMRNRDYMYISGPGIQNDYQYYYMTEDMPMDSSNKITYHLTAEQAEVMVKLSNTIEDLKKKKSGTYEEIFNLLLSFTTWKKALAAMPELKPYAPQEGGNTGLMIVPQKTREKISCLISTTDNSCIEQL